MGNIIYRFLIHEIINEILYCCLCIEELEEDIDINCNERDREYEEFEDHQNHNDPWYPESVELTVINSIEKKEIPNHEQETMSETKQLPKEKEEQIRERECNIVSYEVEDEEEYEILPRVLEVNKNVVNSEIRHSSDDDWELI